MHTNVHGIYETAQLALSSIEALQKQGIDSKHISAILTNEEMYASLSTKSNVSIHWATPEQPKTEEDGFMDNLTEALSGTSGEHERYGYMKDTLLRVGLSEETVESYIDAMEQGSVLVLTHLSSPPSSI